MAARTARTRSCSRSCTETARSRSTAAATVRRARSKRCWATRCASSAADSQVPDREPRAQGPQLVDDDVAVADGVVALEAEQAGAIGCGAECFERCARITVAQALAVDGRAAGDVAAAVAVAVRLGVAERAHVLVRDA